MSWGLQTILKVFFATTPFGLESYTWTPNSTNGRIGLWLGRRKRREPPSCLVGFGSTDATPGPSCLARKRLSMFNEKDTSGDLLCPLFCRGAS